MFDDWDIAGLIGKIVYKVVRYFNVGVIKATLAAAAAAGYSFVILPSLSPFEDTKSIKSSQILNSECSQPAVVLMHNSRAYYAGKYGFLIDQAKAVRLWKCVAARANKWQARAHTRIGFAYWLGKGVPQGRKTAFRHWQKGADAEDKYALTAYARYCTGRWLDICDAELAANYLDQAVENGFGPAIRLQKKRLKQRLAVSNWQFGN